MPFDNTPVKKIQPLPKVKSLSKDGIETVRKFTDRGIPNSVIDGQSQTDYWDKSLPGFGLRVSAGGTRTWMVMYRYNGTKRRMKLGNYPAKGLADARNDAKAALKKAEDGQDPAAEKRRLKIRMDTVEDLAKLYVEQYAKKRKRSWLKDEQILNREVIPVIGRMRIIDVKRHDIRAVLQPIIDRDSMIRATHTLQVIRKMFNWAIDEKDMPIVNPAARMKSPGVANNRARYLSEEEFFLFWKALDPAELGWLGVAAFQLIALTMQREMEVLRMRWQDIDWNSGLWTIPADHAKNTFEHVVPLGEYALACLGYLFDMAAPGDIYVFKSPVLENSHVRRVFLEKRWLKIKELAKLINVIIHDIRRSGVTHMGKLRVPPHIKKKLINHEKKKKSDVTDIYDRFEYLDEKREAMQGWENLLLEMVGMNGWNNAAPAESEQQEDAQLEDAA
jgi:integrase